MNIRVTQHKANFTEPESGLSNRTGNSPTQLRLGILKGHVFILHRQLIFSNSLITIRNKT